MRISDWSSDVCSSDLVKIGRDGQFGRIASAVLPNAAQIGVDADYRSILTEARRDLGQVVGALNAQPRQCAAFERGNRDRHLLQVFRTAIGGDDDFLDAGAGVGRSEEHTSELQSLMRISYAVFGLKKKKKKLIQ